MQADSDLDVEREDTIMACACDKPQDPARPQAPHADGEVVGGVERGAGEGEAGRKRHVPRHDHMGCTVPWAEVPLGPAPYPELVVELNTSFANKMNSMRCTLPAARCHTVSRGCAQLLPHVLSRRGCLAALPHGGRNH